VLQLFSTNLATAVTRSDFVSHGPRSFVGERRILIKPDGDKCELGYVMSRSLPPES